MLNTYSESGTELRRPHRPLRPTPIKGRNLGDKPGESGHVKESSTLVFADISVIIHSIILV